MRCRTCDYPLWQIRDRVCPECGAPFKPREFEFAANSVRFCCPHCDQAYYGTGPRGELVPRSFTCVGCAKPIDMDEMVLLPTEGVREDQTETVRQPWLERGKRRSYISAWFATIGHALTRPGELMRATPPESGSWPGLIFMLLVNVVIGVCYSVVMMAYMAIMFGVMMRASGGGMAGMGVGTRSVGMFGVWGIAAVVFYLMIAGITCLVAHGILKITGGTRYGLGRTWQAICYSSGANFVSAIPCLGGYIGWIWWAASACVAVKEAQRVHGGRAALAVLITPLVLVAAVIGLWVTLIYTTFSGGPMTSTTYTSGPGYTPGLQNNNVRMATIAKAFQNLPKGGVGAGRGGVGHVGELLSLRLVTPFDLMDSSDNSNGGVLARMAAAQIGSTDLRTFGVTPPAQQQVEVAAAIAALPPNTLAYRVGDTVLTHLGINRGYITTGSDAEELWVAIAWPESLVSSTARTIDVALADGTTRSFPAATITAELAQQNAIRQNWGLEPLPNPASVTQAAPAVGAAPPAMTIPKSGGG